MLSRFAHEMFSCSRCGFCREWHWKGVENVCPTYPYTPGFETNYARGRVRMAQAFMGKEIEVTEAFLRDVFLCTLCGSCDAHCPVEIPLHEIFQALRADLAEAGYLLPAHRQIVSNIEIYCNLYGPRRGRKGASALRSARASILYFPGCTTTRKARGIFASVIKVLDKLGQDYVVLEEDACCGYPLYEIGQMSAMREAAARTLDLIEQREPDIVLISCPGCYYALKVLYPEKLGLSPGFQVQYVTAFLLPLIAGKTLAQHPAKVTWHDPCVLGRHLGIYDEPRELLRAIPRLELIEMHSNHENALCCGAGGGMLSAFPEIAGQVATRRLEQAKAAGAQELVTSCPACYLNFRRIVGRAGLDLQVRDLAELISEVI